MAKSKVVQKVVKAAKKKANKDRVRAAIGGAAPAPEQSKQAVAVAAKKATDAKAELQTTKSLAITAAIKELAPIAKEINVRIEKAAKLEGDAGDHRLAAALQLEAASKKCEAAGISFKKWALEHVSYSYENVRKLVAVGASPQPAKALEDLRLNNAEANKRHREAKKAEKEPAQQQPKPELKREEPAAPQPVPEVPATLELMKEGFDKLKPMAKMSFLTWAAEQIGATIKTDFDE